MRTWLRRARVLVTMVVLVAIALALEAGKRWDA
jgi:hypothetical protein